MTNAEYQRAFRERQNQRLERIEAGVEILRKEIEILRKETIELVGLLRKKSPILRKDNSAKSTTSTEPAPTERKRASILTSNWILSLEDRQFAASLGLDPDRTADEFRDYWISEGRAKADWSAAFRNCCRKVQVFGHGKTPPPISNGPSPEINEFRAKQLADLARKGIHVLPGSMT